MDDDVTIAVIGCGIAVDDGQCVTVEVADEAGRRIDDQGRAAYYKQIGSGDGPYSTGDDLFIESFLIKDDIGLYGRSAMIAFGDTVRMDDVIEIEELVAAAAVITQDRAMEFVDLL